ncbi:MAG: type II secretion system protein J [Candidatus Methylomirabilales bacterium]
MAHPSCRGYTLVELMIAMGLSALIVGGMALALQAQGRAYEAHGAGREEMQVLEAAVRQFQQDLQLAGAGLPPRTLPAIAPGSGDGAPVITIRYLIDAPFVTALTADAPEDAKLFPIPPDAVRRFRRGDPVLLYHDGAWLAFRVGDVRSRSRPGLKPDSEVRRSGGDPSVEVIFPRGSKVVRLRGAEVQYLLVQGKAGERRLLRRRGGEETVVAPSVQDLRVEYLVAPADDENAADPHWTLEPSGEMPVMGARVRLAVGQSSVRFTVTPRNLLFASPS